MKNHRKNPSAGDSAQWEDINQEARPMGEKEATRRQAEEDADTLWKLAWEMIDGKRWEEARLVGNYLRAMVPDEPKVHFTLGIIRLGMNDLERAEQCVRTALDLGGDDIQSFLLLAHICALRGEIEGEFQWANKAAALDDSNPEPLFVIAEASRRLGRLSETEAALVKVIELEPEDSRAYRLLGDTYLAMQRLDEAREKFWTVLQMRPEDASLWADLGHTMSRLDDPENALEAFQKAVDLEPENPENFYHLGDACLALGRLDQAVGFLSRALQLDPDYALAHYDLGLAFLQLGRYEEAAVENAAVLQNDPEMAFQRTNLGLGATTNLGLAYNNLGRLAEGEQCFRRNLKLLAPTFFNLGLALFKQGRYQESLVNFERALESEPENPEFLDLLGNAYLELGRLDEGLEALRKAITVDENYSLAHYDLGVTLARMDGRQEEALKSFERAIALDSDLGQAYYGMACIHAQKGDRKLALVSLEEALKKGIWDQAHIESDPDLDGLRNDPKFRLLKKTYLSVKEEIT